MTKIYGDFEYYIKTVDLLDLEIKSDIRNLKQLQEQQGDESRIDLLKDRIRLMVEDKKEAVSAIELLLSYENSFELTQGDGSYIHGELDIYHTYESKYNDRDEVVKVASAIGLFDYGLVVNDVIVQSSDGLIHGYSYYKAGSVVTVSLNMTSVEDYMHSFKPKSSYDRDAHIKVANMLASKLGVTRWKIDMNQVFLYLEK